MKIVIIYPQILDTGSNMETIENISNFQEKPYGISFHINETNGNMFLGYNHIIGYFLTEEDENDT